MTKYLSVEDIVEIHHFIVEETGGSHGVRDMNSLEALVALPQQVTFGKELYPTLEEKASVYVRNIIVSHPFVDGNKRSAMTSAAVFLEDNGKKFAAPKGAVEEFALSVISDKLEIEAIAKWLSSNVS